MIISANTSPTHTLPSGPLVAPEIPAYLVVGLYDAYQPNRGVHALPKGLFPMFRQPSVQNLLGGCRRAGNIMMNYCMCIGAIGVGRAFPGSVKGQQLVRTLLWIVPAACYHPREVVYRDAVAGKVTTFGTDPQPDDGRFNSTV